MTFTSDLVKGIMCSAEQYERNLEGADIDTMESNFAKKIQEMYSAYGN